MGMQESLTAQALGRSPYDEVVEWDQETGADTEPTQEYDHRGRPINPETRRMNRDIVRSHNEVMLVIGVAEQENPNLDPEAESQRNHDAHERVIGCKLISVFAHCVEAVGVFGLNRARQRILVYTRFSHIPFWDMCHETWKDFSIPKTLFPGAPASLLGRLVERHMFTRWQNLPGRPIHRQYVYSFWWYIRTNLELYAVLQRLDLIPSNRWLPDPSFFVPFTKSSPIAAPPSMQDFSPRSLLQWFGGLCISAAPFVLWSITQRMLKDRKIDIWGRIFYHLPSTCVYGRKIPPPPPPPPSSRPTSDHRRRSEAHRVREAPEETSPLRPVDGQMPDTPVEAVRRQSIFSSRDDDFASDDEDMGGVSATLISFDVEASDATDAPAGLWSAELRPSVAQESTRLMPLYLNTTLTRLSPMIACDIFTETISRLLVIPYECVALRLIARTFRYRSGLPVDDIYISNLFNVWNLTAITNFFGAEFLHLSLLGDLWAVFTVLAEWYHQSEEEWKLSEAAKASEWAN